MGAAERDRPGGQFLCSGSTRRASGRLRARSGPRRNGSTVYPGAERGRSYRRGLGLVRQVEVEKLSNRDTTPEVVPAALFAPPIRISYELVVLHDHALVIGTSPARDKGEM